MAKRKKNRRQRCPKCGRLTGNLKLHLRASEKHGFCRQEDEKTTPLANWNESSQMRTQEEIVNQLRGMSEKFPNRSVLPFKWHTWLGFAQALGWVLKLREIGELREENKSALGANLHKLFEDIDARAKEMEI